MASTAEYRKQFVKRLVQACDLSKLVPEPHYGRQTYLATKLGVSAESVSKWFKGDSIPRHDTMAKLAELLEVDQSWLAFGLQPEIPRTERMVHANRSEGAVALVWGTMTLEGARCGLPSSRDSRSGFVDFYATMRGTIYPMYVALARELSKNRFELLLPKEYKDVRAVGVVPAGVGRWHFIDLPLSKIEEHKVRKSGQVSISFGRQASDGYFTGSDNWPRIRTFGDVSWK